LHRDNRILSHSTPGADDNTTRHSHTAYVKNQDGSRTVTSYPDAADTTVYSQSAYDAHGQLTATLDIPGGYKTLNTYNAAGQTTLVVSR
jgi:hypothetical protein